jgi:uncharacterized membrane protein YdjX (TVP38/TMEM64 family)
LRQDGFAYLLVVRLVPLFPVFPVHPVPAAVGLLPRTCAVATFIGILPGIAVFIFAGAGIGGVLDAGGASDLGAILSPEILAALAGLAALSLVGLPLRRRLAARAGG